MVNDIVTVPGVPFEAAKMSKKTEQDLVMKALAKKNVDAVVLLSTTVSKQERDTNSDVVESKSFAMIMCLD